MNHRRYSRVAICLLVLLVVRRAGALSADELLLVVNKNQPESQQLAEFYATARGVPAD